MQAQRLGGKNDIAADRMPLCRLSGDANAAGGGADRVVVNMREFDRQVVISQRDGGMSGAVGKDVVVDGDTTGGLQQRFARVVPEEVAVDLVEVVGAGAAFGETADEQVDAVAIGAGGRRF